MSKHFPADNITDAIDLLSKMRQYLDAKRDE
jgi:hypothetical protein